jgi:SAM-dependent methyltransferase
VGHVVDWTLEHAYDEYPRIEEEFSAALDESLDPRDSDMLYDIVAGFGLPAGAVAVDVGCGEGDHAEVLAERFGLSVTGVDPVSRHIELARAAFSGTGVAFVLGTAESIPVSTGSVDLVWCRDVLVHVADLPAAYAEFRRVLRPGGRALVYQMFADDFLEPREASWLWSTMGVVPASAEPSLTETAIAAAGLRIDERIDVGSEWSECQQEEDGRPGRKLLHAARLLRAKDMYLRHYGQANYDMMLGDSLWHIYAMIGKLTRRVYVLTAPGGPGGEASSSRSWAASDVPSAVLS